MPERGGYDPNLAGTKPWYSPEQFPARSVDAMPHHMMVEVAHFTQKVREAGIADLHDAAHAIAQTVVDAHGPDWRQAAFELSMTLLRKTE